MAESAPARSHSGMRIGIIGGGIIARLFLEHMMPAIADGCIRPLVDRVYGFGELPAAKAYMESNAEPGNIVVRMRDA